MTDKTEKELEESFDYKLTRPYFHKASGKWLRQKRPIEGEQVNPLVPEEPRDDTPHQIKECDCLTFKQFYHSVPYYEPIQTLKDHSTYSDEHVSENDLEGTGLEMSDIHAIHREIDESPVEDLLDRWDGPAEEELEEGLDPAGRLKAKARFNRTSKVRNAKRNMVMAKPADANRLQNRAINMARRMIMAKMLRGRPKSSLSPTEKTNLELRLKNSQGLIRKIAVRVLPKVKSIDRNRISNHT